MAETGIVPMGGQKLHKSSQQLAIRQGQAYQAESVPHISLDQVQAMIAQVKLLRDQLLIRFIVDSCFRASEAIGVRPQDIQAYFEGWAVSLVGKGSRPALVAISGGMAAQLKAYAYDQGIKPGDRIFPITRFRVHQIVKGAMDRAGIVKPPHVGAVHVLRHTGALERLARTGNPKALQDHLRHRSALMTLRYMKTLSQEESLRIQQGVGYEW